MVKSFAGGSIFRVKISLKELITTIYYQAQAILVSAQSAWRKFYAMIPILSIPLLLIDLDLNTNLLAGFGAKRNKKIRNDRGLGGRPCTINSCDVLALMLSFHCDWL